MRPASSSGRVPRVRAHLRAACAAAPLDSGWHAVHDKPQVGTGAPPQPAAGATAAVVKLVRVSERGEAPPLPLLLDCLERVRALDLSAAGGEALLWLLPPVLKAARAELLRLGDGRRTLEQESWNLRLRGERAGLDAEDQLACLLRARERLDSRVARRRAMAAELEAKGAALGEELAAAEAEATALKRRADDGLRGRREEWAREREGLAAELAGLQADAEAMEREDSLAERASQAEERLAAAGRRMEELLPSATRYNEMREKLKVREAQVEDLQLQISSLDSQEEARKERAKAH